MPANKYHAFLTKIAHLGVLCYSEKIFDMSVKLCKLFSLAVLEGQHIVPSRHGSPCISIEECTRLFSDGIKASRNFSEMLWGRGDPMSRRTKGESGTRASCQT